MTDTALAVTLPGLLALAGAAQQLRNPPAQLPPGAMAGERVSRQQGRGLNFDSLRRYQPGDDVRLIDWQATARLRTPWVRLYNEERERPVFLLVDQRLDMYFATRGHTKSVAAAHLAALLAWRSWHDGDRLGAAVFSDDSLRLQRCRSPKLALAPCLNDLHQMNNQLPARYPQEPASSLPLHQVLQRIRAQVPAGSWLALISDFHDLDAQSDALLAALARRCDITAFVLLDDLHLRLPHQGYLAAHYQHQHVTLPLSPALRQQISERVTARLAQQQTRLLRLGIRVQHIVVSEPLLRQLTQGDEHAGKRF